MNENTAPAEGQISAEKKVVPSWFRRLYFACRWALINAGLAWCAWAGVHGNDGAGRLLVFVVWVCGLIQFVGCLIDDVKKAAAKRGRCVPAEISHGVGVAMIGFLVWHGWWWTAIACILGELGEASIYRKPDDHNSSEAEKAERSSGTSKL